MIGEWVTVMILLGAHNAADVVGVSPNAGQGTSSEEECLSRTLPWRRAW
jgi:hypothetical protein